MTVDKGGLRYRITVEDEFSVSLQNFTSGIRGARQEFALARRQFRKGFNVAGIEKAQAASEKLAESEKKLARERRRSNRQASLRSRAERQYAREAVRSGVAAEKAAVASQTEFINERRLLTVKQARAVAERKLTDAQNKNLIQQELINAQLKRGANLTEQQARSLGLASRATIKLTREQKRLQNAQTRLQDAEKLANNEQLLRLEAQRRAIAAITRERLKQLTIQELQARGFQKNGRRIGQPESPGDTRRTLTFFDRLDKRLNKSNRSANRLSFTFRRLFGILAAFAAARLGVQLFAGLLRETLRINAAIETTELGIASLLASVGEVRNLDGERVDAAERLAIAQGIAADQTRRLRIDALATTATFEELADTFRLSLAPGLRAGLNVDQIRQFSREISIAATTVGLEQRQLAEEVRSILSGTIRPQNTRIATFLGITNQDIRRAQEAGELFEFLADRFEVFNKAGFAAAQTFTGLAQRVRGAVQELLLSGGNDFFLTIKTLLDDIFNSILSINSLTGDLELNDDLVTIVSLIGEGLSEVVNQFRQLSGVLVVQDFIEIAAAFRDVVSFAAQIGSAIFQGLVLGLRDVSRLVSIFRETFGEAVGDTAGIRELVAQITRVLTVIVTVSVVLGAITASLKAVRFLIISIAAVSKGLLIAWKGIAATVNAASFAAAFFGTTLSAVLVTATAIAAALAFAAASVLFAAREIKKQFIDGEGTITSTAGAIGVLNAELAALEARRDNPLIAGALFASVPGIGPLLPDIVGIAAGREFGESDAQRITSLKQQIAELEKEAGQRALEIEKSFDSALENITDKFGEIKDAILGDFSDIGQSAEDELRSKVTGILLENSLAADQLQRSLQDVNSTIRREQAVIRIAEAKRQVEQSIADLIDQRSQQELDSQEQILNVVKDIEKREQQISQLREASDNTNLNENDQAQIKAAIAGLEDQISTLKELKDLLEATGSALGASRGLPGILDANADQAQTNALKRIEAIRETNIRLAERERDVLKAKNAEIKADLATLNEEERQRQQTLENTTNAINNQIVASKANLAVLSQINVVDRSEEQQALVQTETELIVRLEERLALLQAEEESAKRITDAARDRLKVEELINESALENPVGTGLLQGVIEANTEAADLFQNTLNIMKGAIQQFSEFIAQSLIDAFDPNANGSIQERFAQFLQNIAKQIIAMLTQLAITAAILNAASGGILGPSLQALAKAQGFADGGDVGKQHRRHQRAQQARSRAHMRARGYAEGGSPGARAVHGVARPRGLDSRDTVAAWLDPNEWVIRGSSVAKAGADALDRINRGLFDPHALRGALGLRSWTRTSHVAAAAGKGLAAGGPASSVDMRTTTGSNVPSGIGNGPAVPAIVVASEEAADRLHRGGEEALLRLLAANGYYPNR